MRLSNRVLAVALALALLAGVSCSCGGGPPATPTPAVTPTPTAMPTPTPPVTSTPAGTPGPEYVEYTDEENGFTMTYPSGWYVPTQEWWGPGDVIQFRSEQLCLYNEVLFRLATVEITEPTTLDSWFEQAGEALAAIEGCVVLSAGELTVDGLEARGHVYTFEMETLVFRAVRIYVVRGDTGWHATCACLQECWDDYESTFETMVDSLHFLD